MALARFSSGGKGAAGERSDSRRERAVVGGGNVAACPARATIPPPASNTDTKGEELRRRRERHHHEGRDLRRHDTGPAGPRDPRPRSGAQAASDNGLWWHSAVESLETKISAIHHLPLSENGARRAVVTLGDLWPARPGGACRHGLPCGVCCRSRSEAGGGLCHWRRSRWRFQRWRVLWSEAEPTGQGGEVLLVSDHRS